MSQVANSADEYASTRLNIFFTAHNQTSVDGNLTGQCVTLIKWFMAEMTDVPEPFSARGDARYVGKRLVAQGHAVEVPYSERKSGDIICMEYGTYGHIYVQLSGGRVFEENVNVPGVSSKLVDGSRVYASRIGSDTDSWRHDMHVYRVKTYNGEEDGMKVTVNNLRYLYLGIYAQAKTDEELAADGWIGQDYATCTQALLDYANKNNYAYWQVKPKLEKQIADLQASGNLPVGTYLKVNKTDIKEVK